jgi:hypothetical protein
MSKLPKPVAPEQAIYIKLGRSGSWEKECLEKGIIRFGYKETPFDSATSGDWDTVWEFWRGARNGNAGTATRDLGQIRHFYEDGEETLWITLSGGLLWWCFAKPGVQMHPDGHGPYRECVSGWISTDIAGNKLTNEKLSGNLLRVQGFRGTICDVRAFDYLIRKLNNQLQPEVEAATKAENEMVERIVPLLRMLTWQDFELLVDLVFSNSGWRRIGQLGKTQKTVDIELLLPTTGERAFVQVKSSASRVELTDYLGRLKDTKLFDKMFFVWHTGEVGDLPEAEQANVLLIGPVPFARMVFEAGLTSWLRDKVS